MNGLKKFLTTSAEFPIKDWAIFEQTVDIRTIPKGTFLIEQGKSSRYSGFLLEGLGRYFAYDADGNDPTCYFCDENSYLVDPYAFFDQKPATLNMEALTDCRVATIGFTKHRELCLTLPYWEAISRQLILKTAMEFANQKDFMNLPATKRYNHFVKTYPSFAKRAPLKYVASYLGIAQPSLSRIRKMPKSK
jgi:CRP-like cAMP-binding protein